MNRGTYLDVFLVSGAQVYDVLLVELFADKGLVAGQIAHIRRVFLFLHVLGVLNVEVLCQWGVAGLLVVGRSDGLDRLTGLLHGASTRVGWYVVLLDTFH